MADDTTSVDTTTSADGTTVALGDPANIPVNGPASADGAAALKAASAKPKKGADTPIDQTIPGGKYILADGSTVDAEGVPV